MLWKKDREEIERLRRQNEQDTREREAARLNLQLALRRLSLQLGLPVERGMASIAQDLAGKRKGG